MGKDKERYEVLLARETAYKKAIEQQKLEFTEIVLTFGGEWDRKFKKMFGMDENKTESSIRRSGENQYAAKGLIKNARMAKSNDADLAKAESWMGNTQSKEELSLIALNNKKGFLSKDESDRLDVLQTKRVQDYEKQQTWLGVLYKKQDDLNAQANIYKDIQDRTIQEAIIAKSLEGKSTKEIQEILKHNGLDVSKKEAKALATGSVEAYSSAGGQKLSLDQLAELRKSLTDMLSFQTAPGQVKQVPGSTNEAVLGLVHGGEFIGRPKKIAEETGSSLAEFAKPKKIADETGLVLQTLTGSIPAAAGSAGAATAFNGNATNGTTNNINNAVGGTAVGGVAAGGSGELTIIVKGEGGLENIINERIKINIANGILVGTAKALNQEKNG